MHELAAPSTGSRFVRACLRQPVDRTPVWFLRQAGRYMPEYMAVRKHHTLLDICRTPQVAAEVTITAAERLGVDAAIIFADLLLPFTPMGVDFEFVAGEGPVVHTPIRTLEQVQALRTDRVGGAELRRAGDRAGAKHFAAPRPDGDQLGIIGFCGAPFTLASYMIEGGSSRNYIETKTHDVRAATDCRLAAADGEAGRGTRRLRAAAGRGRRRRHPDLRQLGRRAFGDRLSRRSACPTCELIRRVQRLGVPVIYFGVDTASLLPAMRETGADVLGLDWRVPLDEGWKAVGPGCAVQGNLDPIALFAPEDVLHARVAEILAQAAGRPGHIFNLGHGIVPGTPVESVIRVVEWVKQSGSRS